MKIYRCIHCMYTTGYQAGMILHVYHCKQRRENPEYRPIIAA